MHGSVWGITSGPALHRCGVDEVVSYAAATIVGPSLAMAMASKQLSQNSPVISHLMMGSIVTWVPSGSFLCVQAFCPRTCDLLPIAVCIVMALIIAMT